VRARGREHARVGNSAVGPLRAGADTSDAVSERSRVIATRGNRQERHRSLVVCICFFVFTEISIRSGCSVYHRD
jgi:hypothetical protein